MSSRAIRGQGSSRQQKVYNNWKERSGSSRQQGTKVRLARGRRGELTKQTKEDKRREEPSSNSERREGEKTSD